MASSTVALTMCVLIGVPASGATTRARQIETKHDAFRLTTDEWMFEPFGDPQPEGMCDILKERLIWLSFCALKRGVNVVMDLGVWANDERSSLRYLAESVGASCELVYLDIDEEENVRRFSERPVGTAVATFDISADGLAKYRNFFHQ